MLRLENIKIYEDLAEEEIVILACKKYKLDFKKVEKYSIFKKSIDARNKDNIFYNYTIDIKYGDYVKNIKEIKDEVLELNIKVKRKNEPRPVIIGAGPAGLFCALILVENGIKPIIIEQGKKVEDRKIDVEEFTINAKLNRFSNVQFGEGGAGTFSDGKLTTGVNNPLGKFVLNEFVKFGAPKQILYINKPHIGTDNLVNIISNMRNYIIENGGEFLFESKLVDFEVESERLKAIIYRSTKNLSKIDNIKNDKTVLNIDKKNGAELRICNKSEVEKLECEKICTNTAVLAIGHSARDTFERIYEKGLNLEKKNFSVGVRIEHKQEMINKSQYGTKTKLKLPPAEYKLAYHGKDRSCYTFCMCPGGVVMPSSSENNEIVTNGMSKFARDGENANSAVLVNVTPDDFKGESPLEGIYFQKELEEKAFKLGGSNFYAPIQKVGDFLANKKTTEIGEVKPTYKPGVTLSNLQEILPDYVINTLKAGLLDFDKKIKGFASEDAILTAVETRSSSPVRIIRDEEFESNIKGIYPCGEGAGYAGGIMTAAMDGIKCAIKILEKE